MALTTAISHGGHFQTPSKTNAAGPTPCELKVEIRKIVLDPFENWVILLVVAPLLSDARKRNLHRLRCRL